MINAIVTDIEGTTSSISFVKDVLFPYARERLPEFVRENQNDTEIRELLLQAGLEAGAELSVEELIGRLINWMDLDKKITPLKTLQGLIWQAGYRRGDFKGHIYEDAARQLKAFKESGRDLYVYSSGSVYAQKLLFSHSDHGDLTPLFSDYFDTRIGGKQQAESYRQIAGRINLPAREILFLSDIKEELDAARQAGFETYWLVRGQTPDNAAPHEQINDFDAIKL